MKIQKKQKAFTLIELMIVVGIVGILAAIIVGSVSVGRQRARDARRRADMQRIATMFELYYNQNRTYTIAAGHSSSSTGWFNYEGGAYTMSGARFFKERGFAGELIGDPSGVITAIAGRGSGYMFVSDANGYTVWANLEKPLPADTATQNTCRHDAWDSYSASAPENIRMNYCVSN